jgi:hypothetical protein
MAGLFLGAGLALMPIGAPPTAIIDQQALAIICAVVSLRVRDDSKRSTATRSLALKLGVGRAD